MSSRVDATGHIQDPVPLIDKRRGLSPGGRFPPSFIHQVIIITGLNKLYNCMFSPWTWPQVPTGCKTSKSQTQKRSYPLGCHSYWRGPGRAPHTLTWSRSWLSWPPCRGWWTPGTRRRSSTSAPPCGTRTKQKWSCCSSPSSGGTTSPDSIIWIELYE